MRQISGSSTTWHRTWGTSGREALDCHSATSVSEWRNPSSSPILSQCRCTSRRLAAVNVSLQGEMPLRCLWSAAPPGRMTIQALRAEGLHP